MSYYNKTNKRLWLQQQCEKFKGTVAHKSQSAKTTKQQNPQNKHQKP